MKIQTLVFGLVIGMVFAAPHAFGQWSFSELANRLSQEKAKLVSYRLVLNQRPAGDGKITRCTLIHEYSSIGEYEAVAVIERKPDDSIIRWGLRGRTEDIGVLGGSSSNELASMKLTPKKEFHIPKFLDWRIVGFSFCGDIGNRFETVAKNISAWGKDSPENCIFTNTKAGVVARFGDDVEIEVEIKDGVRVTMFRHGFEDESRRNNDYTEWKVDYSKSHELMLPAKATLICGKQESEIEFSWLMVNEPLDISAKAILERYAKEIPNARVSE